MEVRPADESHARALSSFVCGPGNESWLQEVQGYVRATLAWQDQDEAREALVLQDGADVLGVVAYEPLDSSDRGKGFYVSYLAIAHDVQGRHYGQDLFNTLVEALALEAPGRPVVWRVHPYNYASQAFCRRMNAGEPVSLPGGYLEYAIYLPDSQ